MLGRIILVLIQLVVGWFAGNAILKWLALSGPLELAALVAVLGLLMWVCGLVGAEVLQGVGRPSHRALVWSLVGAATGVALWKYGGWVPVLKDVIKGLNLKYLPLALAVIGYQLRK
jgi:cytosine/uracil/thiamine/allantoin permease